MKLLTGRSRHSPNSKGEFNDSGVLPRTNVEPDLDVGANSRSPENDFQDNAAKKRANSRSPLPKMKSKSLSTLISGFKSSVTSKINALRNTPGKPAWQRNFYEHVIRNESALNQVREYIVNNPLEMGIGQRKPAKLAWITMTGRQYGIKV